MKHEHFWVMCAAASTALVVIVGAAGAAVAQNQPEQATVIGHRTIEEGLSTRVTYADLNLASASGERALNRRVSKAINFVCEPHLATPGLDFAFRDCLEYASNGARPQVALAVRRAREIALTGTSSIPAVAIAIAVR